MKRDIFEKLLLATLTSAISGAIIGLLFAPEKGADTRKRISDKGDDYLKNLKKEVDEIRHYLNTRAESTKEELSNLGGEAQKRGEDLLDEAKSKGEDLVDEAQKLTSYEEWTKDELYNRAKELEIDNYSQMNKSELINSLRNR